ncbi:MAG: sugar transferase [Acidobacteria bacterium]|jgi:exopolysaccharide production protein ExoY|nr:sugar transferase [Acidobacteriota bacterium]
MEFRFGDQTGSLTDDTYAQEELERSPNGGDFSPKRIFDVVAASAGLLFLAPLLLLVAALIRLQDGQKALYSQPRWGLNGEKFECFKLRSMVPNAAEKLQAVLDADPEAQREWDLTQKLTNDPRITPLGKFIRATSIDELPQLLNIIRGDMSVVGPRPIPLYERAKYGEDFEHYCSVRPGLTGLWQTSGRSNTTYSERIQLDKTYVQTRTFWGDLWIIAKTVPAVLLSVGAK